MPTMRLRHLLPVPLIVLLGACTATPGARPPSSASVSAAATPSVAPNDDLNALLWAQDSLEHDLVYLETYRDAQAHLLEALRDPHWDALPPADRSSSPIGLQPAVILDVDETVLDNSPYQVRLLRTGGEYNEVSWAAWCREERARALPGAVAFTRFAAEHGIAVIYLSNRDKDLDQVTLDNLRKAGLPVAGPDALLGLGTVVPGCEQSGTEKNCRRQLVGRHYRVLMQLGDQIGDFVTLYASNPAQREHAFAPYLPWVGTRWFVFPNPMYGAWESAPFAGDYGRSREQRRQAKIDALRED